MNLELSTLSSNQLIDKVKDLIELAYQLGLEECNSFKLLNLNMNKYKIFISFILKHFKANQMTRGRFLNILDQKTNEDQ